MGARTKLNASYFSGTLFVAALIGWLAQSWVVFCLAAGVGLGINIYQQEIRLRNRGGGTHRRRGT